MSYRSLNSNLVTSLTNNENHGYTHLIKFEKPGRQTELAFKEGAKPSNIAENFSYLTDGAYEVRFDDGSKDSKGTSNGDQTYLPNKVKSIGTISETIEAKATSMNLTLFSSALSVSLTGSLVITAATTSGTGKITAPSSWVSAGFSEGDTVELTSANTSHTNRDLYVRIDRFENDNKDIIFTSVETNEKEGTFDYTANASTITISSLNHGLVVGSTIDITFFSGVFANRSYVITAVTDDTFTFSLTLGSNITGRIRYKKILTSETQTYTALFSSPEINALTEAKEATDYSSYLNRQVFIYRAHINPSTGAIIGAPFLIFKGIVVNARAQEKLNSEATIAWTLTSHWGDFVSVNGRMTSDHAHRALGPLGKPQTDAVFKPEYVSDYGFMHAESAVNVLATYQAPEKRYKFKKSGFLGMGSGRTIEYEVMVDRDVDLEFNLSAKFIPVVYGVQQVSGIPIFAEGHKSRSDKVFVNFALSEGPIQSILDMSIDDNRLICLNDKDSAERGDSSDAKIPCFGRADRGDVLKGTLSIDEAVDYITELRKDQDEQEGVDVQSFDQTEQMEAIGEELKAYNSATSVETGGEGIRHEFKFNITNPLVSEFTFHGGHEDQRANSRLAALGSSKQFKVQNMYYSDMPSSTYYGRYHQVLDTAYVVTESTVDNTQSTVPSIDYVVKGRILDCFNYDRSYRGQGTQSDFDLGDYVTLHATVAQSWLAKDAQIGPAQVQIIDKWSFYDQDGNLDYRFRFNENYHLGESWSTADVKSFYMQKGSSKYYFVAHDAGEQDLSGGAGDTLIGKEAQDIDFFNTNGSTTAPFMVSTLVTVTYGHNTEAGIRTSTGYVLQLTGMSSSHQGVVYSGNYITIQCFEEGFKNIKTASYRITNTSGPTADLSDQFTQAANNFRTTYRNSPRRLIYSSDTIRLDPATSNAATDYYNNKTIKITRFEEDGSSRTKSVRISDYTGAPFYRATLHRNCGSFLSPIGNPTFRYSILGDNQVGQVVTGTRGQTDDKRVTTNPALQLLDYMTNKRYGRGLDIDTDIDLESFLSVARACDEQSTVTVNILKRAGEAQPAVGARYKYATSSGRILFQGKVKSSTPITAGGPTDTSATDFYEVTFEEVIGKLGHRYRSYRNFVHADQIVWDNGVAYKAGDTGTMTSGERTTQIANASFSDADGEQNLNLTKVSGTGHDTIRVSVDRKYGTPNDRNPIVRKKTGTGFTGNGYGLYDSDFCKYWLLLGWDEPEQRYVTRHQTNMTVDTSKSVFSNINAMMKQFNAMLKYSNGKYVLAIKSKAPADSHFTSSFPIKDIDEAEIIGDVSIDDSGSKKKFNTLNTQIIDPANNFSGRSITYVNSDYIKQDRGVKKQGNYNAPGITNYFNARMNVKQMLDESRYGLTAKFTIDSKGYLLQAGDIVRITYSRFGWENKYFRIESLNFSGKGLVQVVAKEHNDTAYVIDHLDTFRNADTMEGSNQGAIPVAKPTVPTSASASDDKPGKVQVTWTNGTNFDVAVHVTQVARHTANIPNVNDVTGTATIIATTPASNYIDAPPGDFSAGDVTNYYWVRHLYTANQGDKHARPHNKSTAWVACGTGTAKQVTPIEIEGNASQGAARGITISDGGVTMDIDGGSGTPKIKGGQSAYDTGTGFFLGYDTQTTSAYKFSVGNSSGNKLKFDGTNLTVTGTVSGSDFQGGTLGQASGASNRIPTTVFSRSVANGKGVPVGTEVGGFVDLTNGHFLFGDANTFISFSPTADDNSGRKLTLKGDLEAENLTVTSSISTPLLKVGRLESGTVRVADIREEVFSEIDSRLGNTGGYYASYETAVGNSENGFKGEEPTPSPFVKELTNGNSGFPHAGETTFLNFALNDQFAAPVALSSNTAQGRSTNDLKISVTFQKKIAGQADSTYVNVGSPEEFQLTETLIPYATRYTAEFSKSATLTPDTSGDATDPNNHISGTSYIYRVVISAVAQPGGAFKSYFKSYYAANGTLEGIGANDQAGSPIFFEIREGSIGSSAGNLDTTQFITRTGDNDTNIEFLEDKIKLNAGGETMVTLTEDTADTITLHKDTTVSTNLTVSGNATVSGDLTVSGTTSTLNTADLTVEDKNIILNYHATGDTSSTASGAGITVQDAVDASNDATILWNTTNDTWDFSHSVFVAGGLTATSGALLRRHVSSWNEGVRTHDIIQNSYGTNLGDYTYLKAAGNGGSGHGIVLAADLGTFFGQTDIESGQVTNNATTPLTNTWAFFKDASAYVKGDLGIGTDNPSSKLTVVGDITAYKTTSGANILSLQRAGATNPWKLAQGHTATDYFEILEGSNSRFTIKNGGNVGIGTNDPAAKLQVEDLGIETTSTSVSSTSATVVDTFAKATFRSARYTVQITQGSAYQCSDIMAIHDGTTAIGTEYAMLETGSVLGTLDVAINGDNVELKVTMAAADAATVKVIRHCVAV